MNILGKRNDGSSNLELFYLHTANLKARFSQLKLNVICDPQRVVRLFEQAPVEIQNDFLHRCAFYYDLCESAMESEISITADKRFVWNTIKKLKLHPPGDLFDLIDQNDHVEIYDPTGRQVFSNFEFLTKTTYSFEQLFWYSWDQLFQREEKYLNQIMGQFTRAMTSAKSPFIPEIEEHESWEILPGHSNRAWIKMKIFSPILDPQSNSQLMVAASDIQLMS